MISFSLVEASPRSRCQDPDRNQLSAHSFQLQLVELFTRETRCTSDCSYSAART